MYNKNYEEMKEMYRLMNLNDRITACTKYFAYCAKTAWYNKKKKVKR